MRPHSRAFLTAEWRNLAMLSFAVDPRLVAPYVPRGTELDTWDGLTFVSLVGFLFADTRLLGVPIPLHRTFEEVNLRFYVRRDLPGEQRRGVTFIRELVPRAAIALVARVAYNEPYTALPMRHLYGPSVSGSVPESVQYEWQARTGWCGMSVKPVREGGLAKPGSQEEFITEHYWGYTRQRDGSTVEYRVEHPPWRVWAVESPVVAGDLADLYGPQLASIVQGKPTSAFVADGSQVRVGLPRRIPA